jgi:hypothetical protein
VVRFNTAQGPDHANGGEPTVGAPVFGNVP